MEPAHRRPSPGDLAAAVGATVPDVLGPGLRLVFCGINPGLWSGAVGHHFAHPGNRFWKVIAAAGITDRVLRPEEERLLLDFGVGITNLVDVATRSAKELTRDQMEAGARRLREKVRRTQPRAVAFLGIGAYRTGFGRPGAAIGQQPETIAGVALWVLPNPSGLQAHYPFAQMVSAFRSLREVLDSRENDQL